MKRTVYVLLKISGVFLACFLLLVSSCNNQEPSLEYPESYYFNKLGDMQIGMAGEFLENEVVVTSYADHQLQVQFEVTSGGGMVENPNQTLPPRQSNVSAKWKTGKKSTKQTLIANIYNSKGKYLTRLTYSAFALQSGKWDTLTYPLYSSEVFIYMARDMVNKKTYIIKENRLYAQGDRYYQWDIVENFKDKYGVTYIRVDNKGTLYVVMGNGELYKSEDQAETFIPCTNPFPGWNSAFRLVFTADGVLWANNGYYGGSHPWHFSEDGGKTWESTDLPGNIGIWELYSLPDGSYIKMDWMDTDDNKCVLFHSTNKYNWVVTTANLPEYTLSMYVTEKGEIIIYNQPLPVIIGEIHKSTDLGKTFTRIYTVPINWSSSDNYFDKVNDTYYMCFPGGGFYKTTDFENFSAVWKNTNLYKVLIDHNNVFYAIDTNWLSDMRVYYGKDIE